MIYVGTFAPMVYWIFLSNYFRFVELYHSTNYL